MQALVDSGLECRIYGLRRGIEAEEREGNLRYMPFSETGFVDDLASAARAAVALRDEAPSVVVTAGGAGVAASSPDGSIELPPHPVEQPQTHGAGDVFVGALAARVASGESLADALRYANAAAALHVGTPEAEREAIGPDDVRRLLEG